MMRAGEVTEFRIDVHCATQVMFCAGTLVGTAGLQPTNRYPAFVDWTALPPQCHMLV